MPVKIAKVKQKSSDMVCAVDMEINNYATGIPNYNLRWALERIQSIVTLLRLYYQNNKQ